MERRTSSGLFVFRGFDQLFCLRKLKIFVAEVWIVGVEILEFFVLSLKINVRVEFLTSRNS